MRTWAMVTLAGCRIGFDPLAGDARDSDAIEGDAAAAICGSRTEPSLAMGSETTCIVRLDGTLSCAGTGFGNQFQRVDASTRWLRVDAAETAFCALDVDCALWCFGRNANGQLGLGDDIDRTEPTLVTPGMRYRDVGAGGFHTCAIREDESLWCSGRNFEGQLGLGITGADVETPQRVGTGRWKSVVRGYLFTCALDVSDQMWCWGDNDEGQLGDGLVGIRNSSPALVVTPGHANDWAAAGAGKQHACTLGKDGTLWCWGLNQMGQVGRGDVQPRQTTPFQVPALWDRVELGRFTTCARAPDQSLSCWGYNVQGEVGVPGMIQWTAPTQIPTPAQWSALSPMNTATCAFAANGDLYCWGDNDFGQLGLGDVVDRPTPIRVPLP